MSSTWTLPQAMQLRRPTPIGLVLLLALVGCGWFGGDGSPPTDPQATEEQPQAGEDAFDEQLDTGAEIVLPAEDTDPDAPPPDDIPPEPAEEEPAPSGDRPSRGPLKDESGETPGGGSASNGDLGNASGADAPKGETTEILVELSPEKRQELELKAREDLEQARQHSANVRTRPELTEEQIARLETLDQYISSALESLEKSDVRAASSLALKARLLGEELDPN